MRNLMQQTFLVCVLLMSTISMMASLEELVVLVITPRHQRSLSEMSRTGTVSENTSLGNSGKSTPILEKFDSMNREMSCDDSEFSGQSENRFGCSECGTKAPSDCGTRISECPTKVPSDCGTRISDEDIFANSIRRAAMRLVKSRGSLSDFFDENGNPYSFEPTTPLTTCNEGSPMKKSASRRSILQSLTSPKK